MSYHSFLIVISLWVNTHNHPHFSFPIKVVFEEVRNFGVPVRHHLEDNKRWVELFWLDWNYKIIQLYNQSKWGTNLTGSTHLVFTQDFNTGTQSHQRLVDVTCTWANTLLNACKSDGKKFLWFKDQILQFELTCFPKATSLCSGSVGALAACQIHQTQLAHIHLVFVLNFNTWFDLNRLESFLTWARFDLERSEDQRGQADPTGIEHMSHSTHQRNTTSHSWWEIR